MFGALAALTKATLHNDETARNKNGVHDGVNGGVVDGVNGGVVDGGVVDYRHVVKDHRHVVKDHRHVVKDRRVAFGENTTCQFFNKNDPPATVTRACGARVTVTPAQAGMAAAADAMRKPSPLGSFHVAPVALRRAVPVAAKGPHDESAGAAAQSAGAAAQSAGAAAQSVSVAAQSTQSAEEAAAMSARAASTSTQAAQRAEEAAATSTQAAQRAGEAAIEARGAAERADEAAQLVAQLETSTFQAVRLTANDAMQARDAVTQAQEAATQAQDAAERARDIFNACELLLNVLKRANPTSKAPDVVREHIKTGQLQPDVWLRHALHKVGERKRPATDGEGGVAKQNRRSIRPRKENQIFSP